MPHISARHVHANHWLPHNADAEQAALTQRSGMTNSFAVINSARHHWPWPSRCGQRRHPTRCSRRLLVSSRAIPSATT